MSSGYNEQYVQAAQYQADSNEAIAGDTNSQTLEAEKVKSEAVIQQAQLDYDARIAEMESNERIQMEALRVREKEAEYDFRARMAEAKNDGIRAEASLVTAQAKADKNEVDREENQQDYDVAMARMDDGSGNYWYG